MRQNKLSSLYQYMTGPFDKNSGQTTFFYKPIKINVCKSDRQSCYSDPRPSTVAMGPGWTMMSFLPEATCVVEPRGKIYVNANTANP